MIFTSEFKLAIATKPSEHLKAEIHGTDEKDMFFKSPCGAAVGWKRGGEERFPLACEALDFGFLLHAAQRCSVVNKKTMDKPVQGDWAKDLSAASAACVVSTTAPPAPRT